MKRKIYRELVNWKQSTRRKPLLLRGARQTGKTYILKQFGDQEYSRTAYFNFEEIPDLDDFFSSGLDPPTIIESLSLYIGWQIEPGKDLIIFDEIQASNSALNSLKYFYEKANQYHIIAAGSLLGLKLSKPKSFPVGQVNFLHLYPMTFQEFLRGIGKENLSKVLENTEDFTPYPGPIHNELQNFLKKYFYIGGMPEAVEYFQTTGNLLEVRAIQREIIKSYELDFAKHATTSDIPKLSLIWDFIPVQLARENKKFIFSALKKTARARDYENAIEWLSDAGLIYRSYRVTTAKHPLKGFMDKSAFKVFVLDVGLLGAMARISPDILIRGDSIFEEYKGAFVENYVAQQLQSDQNISLYYWKSEGKAAELDFICEFENQIYPLETKAGINPRSKSLNSYDRQFSPDVLSRSTLLNLKHDGKICNYPLYALILFPSLYLRKKCNHE